MNEDRLLQLARLIKDSTKKGQLSWTPDIAAHTYKTPLGIGSVAVYQHPEPEKAYLSILVPSNVASLIFHNDRGQQIGAITCTDISDSEYPLLADIYHMAESTYLKTDTTFQSMFDDLQPF